MNATVREWIAKAEADYWTASRELQVTERRNYDAVCFHAQQCVEKLMKAVLIHRGVVPPRIHDLVQLNRLLAPLVKGWSWSVEELRFLTGAAVGYRYPGESADQDEANQAVDICTRLRHALLALFEDADHPTTSAE
jgi:HEPN domain-containing protein